MSGCGCGDCRAAAVARTPLEVYTPPGHAALTRRVGTHAEFLATALARLASPAYPALNALTVRSTDDPAIGLLDASAVLNDLLTFYTERIAGEGYLRTATEQRSLALLGRLVGHLPRPGVAAGTYLAYAVDADPTPGRDAEAHVPRGSRAQSVPGPGEEPQAFEGVEDLVARHSWNDLRVRTRRPYQLTRQDLARRRVVRVAGVTTNVKPGDRLLWVFGSEAGRQELEVVADVVVDRESDTTAIGKPALVLEDLRTLRGALQAYLDELFAEPDEVMRRSVILRRFVDGVLRPLREDLGRDPDDPGELPTPTDYAERLAADLARLDEARAVAEHYAHVHAWLGERRAALVEQHDKARGLEPPQPEEPGLHEALGLGRPRRATGEHGPTGEHGSGAPPPDREPGSALLGLGALLGALRTPPSRSPDNAGRLRRDVRELYASGSDLAARLLTALDRRLADALYPAWRQVDLSAPRALRELLAMRQVATPFAATAPLNPNPPAGSPARPAEWELDATQRFTVTAFYDAAEQPDPDPDPDPGPAADPVPRDTPTSAELVFELDANAWRDVVDDLTTDGERDFGPGRVAHAVGADGAVTLRTEAHLPEHRITLSKVDAADRVAVTIPDLLAEPVRLAPDDEQRRQRRDPRTERLIEVTLTRKPASADRPLPAVSVTIAGKAPVPATVLTLDAVYDGVGVGGWVVVERPRKTGATPGAPGLALVTARVTGVRTIAKQGFGISGKVTELVLDRPWLDARDTRLSDVRDTTVYLRGEPLTLAEDPITDDVGGAVVELADLHEGLAPGRRLVVTGERTDIPGRPTGVPGTELAMIAAVTQDHDEAVPGDRVHTTLTLAVPLAYTYRRETVRINANVVRATHGASRDEPIGSGDASVPGQRFLLRQGPLTWLASDDPRGAESTLEVRVDGVRRREVDSFAGRGPTERVHTTRPGEAGSLVVAFGDGVRGARLPTGVENVRARYRVGLGEAGNVGANRITQLATRPLGVSGVTNPLPAHGGADPDDAGLLRRQVPLGVTAFDRLVSVADHEDFARARAGIGRASARQLSDGARQVVHLTVAGVDDIALYDDSDIVTTLRAALAAHGDAGPPVRVAVRELVLLVVAADIGVHPDHRWDVVEPAVRAALLDRLGFRNRELGQPAHLSEVLAIAQAVPGVDHVDVDAFAGVPGGITPAGLDDLVASLTAPRTTVPARKAVFDETRYRVPAPETLTAVAAKHGIAVRELLRLNPGITTGDLLAPGSSVVVFRGVRPAQLVLLSPAVPDTLILKEARP
ncbi:putative baseplate assembly protein [Saccharothrix sp. Mg75]|uniref:putative baseplate assembly protein n=1 Tax=Saccharothrix sp. Mg75 TaxID=3445357 RepID=UPI003EEA7CF6